MSLSTPAEIWYAFAQSIWIFMNLALNSVTLHVNSKSAGSSKVFDGSVISSNSTESELIKLRSYTSLMF